MSPEAIVYQAGDILDYTATADKTSGEVVQVDDGRAGVIVRDIDFSGDPLGSVQVRGVFKATKTASASAFNPGDKVYWDATNNVAVDVGGDFFLGTCIIAATLAATQVIVDLNEDHSGAVAASGIVFEDDFLGKELLISESGSAGQWAKVIVGSATVAAVSNVHGGAVKCDIEATSEAQDADLYFGDNKCFDIDKLQQMRFRFKIVTPGTGVRIVIGMAGDHNLDKDAIAQSAWFSVDGGLDLKAETDDGTNNNDDKAVATIVTDTWYDGVIDFTDTADVKFYLDGAQVATATTFDMSNYTGNLQPYIGGDKASGTVTGSITVDNVRITATR
jgi:predicted RecA/RadA family phage recombinase